MNNQEMVREFHDTFGLPARDEPTPVDRREADLRMKLLEEETTEVVQAIYKGDVYNLAKELADVVYVAYGTAVTYGIDLDKVFAEVHRSNMSKLDEDGNPILREDGKILKGPNYFEPNIEKLLEE
jgi:predicted HAD superfamily Cof-like phosphohydrolase